MTAWPYPADPNIGLVVRDHGDLIEWMREAKRQGRQLVVIGTHNMTSVSYWCYGGDHAECKKDQSTCICPCHDPDAVQIEEVRP